MLSSLRYRYQTTEFDGYDVHYRTLRDRQQFEDIDGEAEALGISSATWPLFGVVWPAGEVLAHLMLNYDINKRKILEVGCGVGLASLVLNERLADITATDNHPSADAYLQHNVSLNNGRKIPFMRRNWDDCSLEIQAEFDLIIGSDLLYESSHAKSLSAFIERYALPTCEVVMIDGGRGHGGKFNKCMTALGYSHQQLKMADSVTLPDGYKGKINQFKRIS